MSKENKSKYALLGVLSLGSMSGYDLKKTIEESVGYFWKENYAQIYPMLKVLEHEGLAVGSTEKHEGKPDRRVYTITEHGKEVLKDWLVEPFGGMQVERNELLLKLFWAIWCRYQTVLRMCNGIVPCIRSFCRRMSTSKNTHARHWQTMSTCHTGSLR